MSTPPSSRPIDAPLPAIAPKIPNAFARSAASVKVVVSSDSAAGARIAPNSPCTARAATSMSKLCAAPPTAEATAKPARPPMNVHLRPKRSDEPPAEQQQAAEGQRVGGDDPLPLVVGEVQRVLGGGQRDVHDGRVEHDHQLGESEHREDAPASRVVGGGGEEGGWGAVSVTGGLRVLDKWMRCINFLIGSVAPKRIPSIHTGEIFPLPWHG